MKKHYKILEIVIFSIIFIFYTVPPFFTPLLTSESLIFSEWKFPVYQIVLGSSAIIFYIFYISEKKEKNDSKTYKLITFSISFIFGFCLLCFVFLTINGITKIVVKNQNPIYIVPPKNIPAFIFCLLNFLFSAVYEEVLYRSYFTDALINICNITRKNFIYILIEFSGLIVFAFAHFYEGIPAVINAALAHCILRIIYLKFKNLPGIISAHFCYNIFALYLSQF